MLLAEDNFAFSLIVTGLQHTKDFILAIIIFQIFSMIEKVKNDSGITLIFLHGLGGCGDNWKHWLSTIG